MRRIVALLLTGALLLPLFGVSAAAEETAPEAPAVLSFTEEELAARFLELKEQFPDGSYWNRPVGVSYWDSQGQVIREVFESVTDHKCDRKSYVCKGQCVGFAWMMADLIYLGQSTGKSHTTPGYTRITDRGEMTHVEPGDIISGRCGDFNHEAIVWKVENGKIYVAECWGSAKSGCRINWHYFDGKNKYATWDAIKKATEDGVLVLYRHPAYSTGEEPPAEEVPAEPTKNERPAEPSHQAQPSTQTVLVDGQKVEFQMYALTDEAGNQTNYVPLRQLASALSGTDAQFDVGWNGAVYLVKGVPYTPGDSDGELPFEGPRAYAVNLSGLKVDGVETKTDSITLTDDSGGGHTCFQLRELGGLLGFAVDWSAETGITIETR